MSIHHDQEYVVCNLCGVDDSLPFFIENGCHVVRCKRCGLVYVNPRPVRTSETQHYESTHEYLDYIQNYVTHKDAHLLKAKRMLKEIEGINNIKGKLLEIGCAAGFFLKVAHDSGWDVQGLEPIESNARYAIDTFSLDVKSIPIEKAEFPVKCFDIVVAFDVLSHLKNPTEFFLKVKKMLKDEGLFVFKTGNKGAITTKKKAAILGEVWLTPDHLYHFSEHTLSVLIEKTGFKKKKIIREHIVDHLLSDENLMIRRDSCIKWHVKQVLLRFNFLKTLLSHILRFYLIKILKADVCSLLVFVHKDKRL